MIYNDEKYINLYSDFGFKKMFGTDRNKDFLIDFLNELIFDREITDLQYLNPEQLGRSAADRRSIYDICCETKGGEKIIVEMQRGAQDFFKDRNLFYAALLIQAQGVKGEWNYDLKAVYIIGIMDFIINRKKEYADYCYTAARVCDLRTREEYHDKLTFISLEMPKFKKTENELETHFDKWLYVLKRLPYLEERPDAFRERIFQRLFTEASISALSKAERAEYELSVKVMRDNYSVEQASRNEGRAEGMKEGMEKGMEKGMDMGMDKKAIEVARNLLADGLSVEYVARISGLSPERIKELNSD
ncbi:MAG: Rpn family recombination-promoting nuclease/putative transposase [Prevotellaceae bacterium]|jgi:predicted transposase/invertase (TIGR01784 family)|nr:Rpn family recombination-promoting nuclease/putative transposase [Prevotellaceae bacterium]